MEGILLTTRAAFTFRVFLRPVLNLANSLTLLPAASVLFQKLRYG
jgi:hypothetical protein